MTTDQFNDQTDEFAGLLEELIDLRRAVATSLGREQYVYHFLDRAIESRFEPALRSAIDEFHRQPIDVQRRIRYTV